MIVPRDPVSIAILAVSLAALLFVLGSCIGLLVAYAKRAKVVWGRTMRSLVGVGGTATSLVMLLLPPGAAWLLYLRAVGRIDEVLATAAPDEKSALMAQAVTGAWNAVAAAGLADLMLLLPCAVLAGLSLTVPFFLRDRKAEGS